MALVFKMDLVWWIDIFIGRVLPVLAFVIAILSLILAIDTFCGGKYEKRKEN